MTAQPMRPSQDFCSRCGEEYAWRAVPRKLRHQRDRDRCRAADSPPQITHHGTVVWVERLDCRCSWWARVRMMDHELLPELGDDPAAVTVAKRRAAQ